MPQGNSRSDRLNIFTQQKKNATVLRVMRKHAFIHNAAGIKCLVYPTEHLRNMQTAEGGLCSIVPVSLSKGGGVAQRNTGHAPFTKTNI